jgi:hypothetical protein
MQNIILLNRFKPLFALLLLAFVAYGQQQKRIAIINTVDDGEPPIGFLELGHLTDRLREIANKTLPQKSYAVMTQQSMIAYLGSQDAMVKKCKEAEGCLAKLGREIQADYVGQGRIGRFGNDYTIKVELYDSRNGNLISSFTGSSPNVYGLLSVLDNETPAMFRKMSGVPGNSSPVFAGGISGLESAVDYELDYVKRYLVNLITEPEGAALSFDGEPIAGCIQTPCKAELAEGEVRIVAALEQYERTDTTAFVQRNNQNIVIKLKPNFGVLEIKTAYQVGVGKYERWNLTINDKAAYVGENRLSPGRYAVKLTHRCYEDISFNLGINKGDREVFDMEEHIKLKKGGLILSAERDGEPVSEPVFVNGLQLGETPFGGSVPLCSEIEIGNNREKIEVELTHNEKVAFVHKMQKYKPAHYNSHNPPLAHKPEKSWSWGSFFTALACDIAGAAFIYYGYTKEKEATKNYEEYSSLNRGDAQAEFDSAWGKLEKTREARDLFYLVGGGALIAGIGIHIWF